MTNAEKYKEAIRAQICKTGDWMINKQGEVEGCMACRQCMFACADVCDDEKINWLLAEADEKKVFSEKDKEVIRALDKVQWVARDKDGRVYGYEAKPRKEGSWQDCWYCFSPSNKTIHLTILTTAEFAPVKWEDNEPTSREEILGEEK